MTLFESFYRTVKKYRPGVQSLSVRLGKSEWWLYKLLTPEDWTKFPIGQIIPLIETTKDPSLLKSIAKELGYEIYKIPKRGISKAFRDSTELQEKLFKVATSYHEFCEYLQKEIDPTDTNIVRERRATIGRILDAIDTGIHSCARARHQVEKYKHKQQDLFADIKDEV